MGMTYGIGDMVAFRLGKARLIGEVCIRDRDLWGDGSDSYELVQDDSLTMTAGTYTHPGRGTPFDERNPEAVKSMIREDLRRQVERDEAVRQEIRSQVRRDADRKGDRS